MPTKKMTVKEASKMAPLRAVVTAFGASGWTEHQAKVTVKNLKTFATELMRGKLGIGRRIRANFACLKVEVKDITSENWRDVEAIVSWLRRTAADLDRKKFRANMAARYRARMYR